MTNPIEKIYSVILLVTGLSHLAHPKLWVDFFTELFKSRFAPLIIGLLTLPLSLLLVVGHNVWVLDIPLIVTLAGWVMFIKSAAYLLYPATLSKVAPRRPDTFSQASGALGSLMTVLGLLLAYHAFLRY